MTPLDPPVYLASPAQLDAYCVMKGVPPPSVSPFFDVQTLDGRTYLQAWGYSGFPPPTQSQIDAIPRSANPYAPDTAEKWQIQLAMMDDGHPETAVLDAIQREYAIGSSVRTRFSLEWAGMIHVPRDSKFVSAVFPLLGYDTLEKRMALYRRTSSYAH